MSREQVEAWVTAYERAWRTHGTAALDELFSENATYSAGPFERPFRGRAEIAQMWEAERDGPDEVFTMASEVVAVEGRIAVVRVAVEYGDRGRPTYRDLWIIELDGAGLCTAFEEWPFWPPGADGAIAGMGGK